MAKTKTTCKNSKSQWKGVRDCRNFSHPETLVARKQLNTSTKTATKNPKEPKTVSTTTILMPMPLKRSKRISLNEQKKLSVSPVDSVHLTTQGRPPRKTASKTPRMTSSDTPQPPNRSKRVSLSKQSNLEVLPLSGSLEVSSPQGGCRKKTSKTPRTTDTQLKRSKRISSHKQSKLPISVSIDVSSVHLKMRGRPSGNTTAITPITTSKKSIMSSDSGKRSKCAPLLLEDLSTNVGIHFRKRTTQTARNEKGLCSITPAPEKVSKRTSPRNQNKLTEPSVSKVFSESLKTRTIPTRDTSSLMRPKIKASKRETSKMIEVSFVRLKKTNLSVEKNRSVSLGGSSTSSQRNQKQKTTTITANKRSRKGQTETTSVPVPFKRLKRIVSINENKHSVSLAASVEFLKTRRNQSSIRTRSTTKKECLTSTAIIGSQVMQNTLKTAKVQTSSKKTTKIAKSSRYKKQSIGSSRSPIEDVDFQVCDEISIAQNGIQQTQTKNPFKTPTTKKRKNSPETSEILSAPSTLTSALSSRSIDHTFKTPSKPSNRLLSRRPSIRVSSLEPLICRRNTSTSKDRSDIQLAKESLHVSAVPKTLICRETKIKEIYKVIECSILERSGGCMYVSGVPGSGKTASITKVIKSLQLQTTAKNLPEFQLIEINAMRLTEPEQAYVHIYHQITGETFSWEQALSLLETLFHTSSLERKTTVLVVDEFDKMKSQRDRVIFNLLDWTTKKTAQLLMIAIGNIINPSQLITSPLTSRLGSTRFTFQPYTHHELQKIVQARLTGINIFDNEAIQLVAKKVASISGDCRRALDICRRAAEIGEKDSAGKKILITALHVCKAFDEMITNLKVIAIKGCSKYEKLFLQAVAAEVARTGVDETVLFQVYRQLESICALNGVAVPDPGIALRISSRLGSSRLLICEHSSASIHQKIMLNVTEQELRYALDM